MTTITRERLEQIYAECEERDPTIFEIRELARIAQESLTAEPKYWLSVHKFQSYLKFSKADAERDVAENGGLCVVPLYTAPPAPVVPDEKPMPKASNMFAIDAVAAIAEARGWNACRTTMLQGKGSGALTSEGTIPDEPVSNRDELPPGIKPAPELDSVAINAKSLPSNSPVIPDCWCHTCRPVTMGDMRFVVCPECGNKRCPHANDHRNACTGSNAPGQEGSAYPAAPQQEVNP